MAKLRGSKKDQNKTINSLIDYAIEFIDEGNLKEAKIVLTSIKKADILNCK